MCRIFIGIDWNYNRYWFFLDEVLGLFIEKGWVYDSIDYWFNYYCKDYIVFVDEDYCFCSKKVNLGKNVNMNI